MPAPLKRDREYYESRLKTRYPSVYADFLGGKYKSVREASIAAGIVKSRSPLMELRSAWRKASRSERDEFIKDVTGGTLTRKGLTLRLKSSSTPLRAPALDSNRKLHPQARALIIQILASRDITPSRAIVEIDPSKKTLDASLGLALSRNTRLSLDSNALERWIEKNCKALGIA